MSNKRLNNNVLSPSVSAEGLSIGYPVGRGRWKIVHSDMDFDLYPGELTCLIGLNGAGKSTLLRTICRFQPAAAGKVSVLGRATGDYSSQEFSLTVGAVLTEKTNVGGITVYDLVSLGRHPHTGFFGILKKRDREIIEMSMLAAGIGHKAGNYVSELSDGERQRVMIAKVLAQECPVIVLDEPTVFLDVASRMETMALLRKTAAEMNKTVLLSTHDIDNAIMYGDKLMLLSDDAPIYCGTPEDLIIEGRLTDFFEKRGMNFDVGSGRLSTGSSNTPVGVGGDRLMVRWMSNALFRNGFTPANPSEHTVNVICNSDRSIDVQYPCGLSFRANGISEAVKNILENSRGEVRDGK